MPDSNPSAAVGDIAEIEWRWSGSTATTQQAKAQWNGHAWALISSLQIVAPVFVMTVRPLRFVDADAVVLPAKVPWAQDQTKAVGWAEMDWRGFASNCSDRWGRAAMGAIADALDAAAVVSDEGPVMPSYGAVVSDEDGEPATSKSEPPVLDVRVDAPSELRADAAAYVDHVGGSEALHRRERDAADQHKAFVLRTVADAIGQISIYSGIRIALSAAADRLSAPTTPGEAVSGVSGELSGAGWVSPCTCGVPGLNYDGPQEDCDVHGESRSVLIAQRVTNSSRHLFGPPSLMLLCVLLSPHP